LADEYLRLSYHGLRAKDKSFQAHFKLDIEPDLPSLYVNSQDIGRVLLNLINNAFYAVSSKASSSKESGYKPEIIVTTSRHLNAITVSIKDNGGGIPPEIKDKIFQPFFTTKPPGEGTGLGLSLSFEIIKAHGGEIIIDTEEVLGTTITISLPINQI
jgi:two-component system, NtrC family, sensor kinase